MRQYTKTEKEGDAGHSPIEAGDMRATHLKISKKIKENILSGKWPPETRAEIEMLREHRLTLRLHRLALKKKKNKKKL